MGSIRKTPSGKFITDVRDYTGKRIREVYDKHKYAKAFVDRTENEKSQHKLIQRGLLNKRSSFSNTISEFLAQKKELKDKSKKKYKRALKQFELFCEKEKLEYTIDFTRENADKFWKTITNTEAEAKTVNFYLMVVKSLFKYEINKDRLTVNPFSHINPLKEKTKSQIEREEEYFTEEEIKSFFNVKMRSNDRQVFETLLLTGLRISELQSLKWDISIDLDQKMIKIRNYEGYETKTEASERDIPMTDHLYEMLSKITKDEGYVFTSEKGSKVSERTLLTTCKKIAKEAGIKKNATLHKWRHTFATHAANTEITYEERQDLLGHKPESMTDRYTKVDPKKLHKKLSELDNLIR